VEIHQIKRSATAFQQPVNKQDLRLQLTRELAGEKIIAVTELESGQFNNTYRVNTSGNDYILKVAPGRSADVFYNERCLMQRERSVSGHLQSASPLIPEYLSFFTVGDRDAFLQPWIQGKLWHEVITSLSDAENATLWKQLGAFARTLHNCNGEQFGYPAPLKRFNRWSRFITDNVEGMAEDCRRHGVFCEDIGLYLSYLEHFREKLDTVSSPRLLHGDLWPRNVIIDGSGTGIHINAVIDGERAFWGDPVSDWVLILYGVPGSFWQGYGENLLHTSDPACIALYKGMYFILNILETVRFQESDDLPGKRLSAVNRELERYLIEG
jgi:aminoglycoside phosphotransferase (APT) family kinase protein